MNTTKISRNDPCPCGSGKKYKQCCQNKETTPSPAHLARLKEGIPDLFKQAIKHDEAGLTEKAAATYQQILDISPKYVKALHNLGILAIKQGQAEKGVQLLRQALHLEPSASHYCSLAHGLSSIQQHDEAIACLKQAIALNPGNTVAYNNLGSELWTRHRYEEAIFYLQKALSINPQQDTTLGNLGLCYIRQGKYKEACECFQKAIAINPFLPLHYNNLLFCLCFDHQAFAESYLQQARNLDRVLTARTTIYQDWFNTETRPLRVGLVTGDIRNHPVAFFLESIVASLDPSRIQLTAYNTLHHEDALTARIKPHFAQWTNIASLSDKQAAQKVRDDGIHILIDLAGHTANNRLPMFAWKPAPIQISWLGYFASTGLDCMDYFLADPISVPEQHQAHFSEKIWYLPETRLCFTAPDANLTPDISALPALAHGYTTFGCFQALSKINSRMLNLWARILQSCPNSKLMFKNHQLKDLDVHDQFLDQLRQWGITVDRVILEEGGSRADYFSSYNKVDFMLDTFPYPGGTTTCEALWMGVPTLTLGGETLLERQGMAMMTCVGLPDWIARTEQQYVEMAIQHAHNLPDLAKLRAELRTRVHSSPLMDAPRFARHFEQALEGMWQQYAGTRRQ